MKPLRFLIVIAVVLLIAGTALQATSLVALGWTILGGIGLLIAAVIAAFLFGR